MIQVVILAGGMGTRLKSVTGPLPKSLVEVAGKPFLDHQLDLLSRGGIERVLLCVGYGADEIENHLASRDADLDVTCVREDPDALLGTGGALVNAWSHLEDEFFVLYGDSYLPMNYAAAVEAFKGRSTKGMMCVFKNEGAWDASNVRIAGGRVVYYSKEAQPGEADYIDYGLTGLTRAVMASYRDRPLPLDLAVIQADLVNEGELAAFEVGERFYEVGKPEGLEELDALLRKQQS